MPSAMTRGTSTSPRISRPVQRSSQVLAAKLGICVVMLLHLHAYTHAHAQATDPTIVRDEVVAT
jgi:hypothetical protein